MAHSNTSSPVAGAAAEAAAAAWLIGQLAAGAPHNWIRHRLLSLSLSLSASCAAAAAAVGHKSRAA